MRTHYFGSREVSVIGLGSTDFGGKCPESQARDFLDAYLALDGNLIDTAHVYGDFVTPRNGESEKVIGRWMADRHVRDQIFLSTKGAHPPIHNMHESRLSREDIRTDMAESLDALGTDRTPSDPAVRGAASVQSGHSEPVPGPDACEHGT